MDTFSAHRQTADEFPLNPEKTAILVVDMVNDFCETGGLMELPGAAELFGPQNELIDEAREAGAVIVFVNDSHRPGMRRDREFVKRAPHCIEETDGADVVSALHKLPSDISVTKRRYSGFFATDLDLTLKDMQIDAVVVMGVVTNICVRSTVHDAFFLGYQVVVPQDCVAATGPREQASSLYDIGTHFGLVSDSQEVIVSLKTGQSVLNRVSLEPS